MKSVDFQLENVLCWEPGRGFAAKLDKATVSFQVEGNTVNQPTPKAKEVQVGPYRLRIEFLGGGRIGINDEEFSLAGLMESSGAGAVFVSTDNVEVTGFSQDGRKSVLGHARGCFDISW